MNSFKLWIAIGMLVLASSSGDIMLSAAMKRIGDLEELRIRKGLLAVIGHMHAEGAFLAIVVAECSMAVAGIVLFRQGRWRKQQI